MYKYVVLINHNLNSRFKRLYDSVRVDLELEIKWSQKVSLFLDHVYLMNTTIN